MPPFENITNSAEFETVEEFAQDEIDGLQGFLRTAAKPLETTNSFSISHKNPELHSVMQATEIMNVSHNELSACAIDASFQQAKNELINHCHSRLKLSGLSEEALMGLLESLNVDPKNGEFPLFEHLVKTSFA
ncbi:MAG TPA: hypothetical protein EYN91_16530 [Candidatus Melainabacteria bacterium]|jgi:hypothetical protein|nr:hypothetical protein [Candidatus Melainabacteria bacterium]HIN64650.1 hypothetical protein [Candidatus Obscuribacterales bacterium]